MHDMQEIRWRTDCRIEKTLRRQPPGEDLITPRRAPHPHQGERPIHTKESAPSTHTHLHGQHPFGAVGADDADLVFGLEPEPVEGRGDGGGDLRTSEGGGMRGDGT